MFPSNAVTSTSSKTSPVFGSFYLFLIDRFWNNRIHTFGSDGGYNQTGISGINWVIDKQARMQIRNMDNIRHGYVDMIDILIQILNIHIPF